MALEIVSKRKYHRASAGGIFSFNLENKTVGSLDTTDFSRVEVQFVPNCAASKKAETETPTRLKSVVCAPESACGQRGVSPLQAYALRPVTECNCVAKRRGGGQQEVNDQSVR